jgi:hypothetical protein
MSITTLPVRVAGRGLAATTPGRMMLALAILAALAVGSAVAALTVLGHMRAAVQTIGYDAEPSVVAAQLIGARLAAMDAAAIGDALTDNGAASGTSRAFRDHLAALNATLVTASHNITYGEAEAAPLRGLVAGVERYLESLAENRWMGRDSAWLTVRRAHWSSRLLNDTVLPDAVALEQANLEPLEAQYAAYQSSSVALATLSMACFAIFLAALVATQVFLLRRTRRLVNIPLATATVLTAVAMAGFGAAMLAEQADTRAAKQDAFDSIHALYGAKVAAYELRAERAMWLLDPATRTQNEARFTASARALLAVDPSDVKATGDMIDALNRALAIERAGRPADALATTPKLGGLLGDELANITFGVAERQPATDSVVALLNYLEIDREIRRLELSHTHERAVILANSERSGGSVAAFDTLDGALDRTIAVNESEFRRRTGDAIALLGWLPWATCLTLAAALLLAGAGIWQRWREYR